MGLKAFAAKHSSESQSYHQANNLLTISFEVINVGIGIEMLSYLSPVTLDNSSKDIQFYDLNLGSDLSVMETLSSPTAS